MVKASAGSRSSSSGLMAGHEAHESLEAKCELFWLLFQRGKPDVARMKKHSVLLGAGVAAILAALLSIEFLVWDGAHIPYIGHDGSVTTLTLYGNVERREVHLGFNVPGRIEQMVFEEGDAVEADEFMARLDQDRFREELKATMARVRRQRAIVDELETGTRPEEIKQARARVASARATLTNQERVFLRKQKPERDNFASQQELDDARAARDEAEARLRVAEQELALALEGPREEEIRAALAEFEALQAEVALAKERLEDSELFAPTAGTILSRVVEPGAIVLTGQPIYVLAVRDPVWVRGYVAETELGDVRPGMTTRVFTDSRPNRPYRGQVGFISPTAEFTPKSVHTPDVRASLVYRIRVVVQNPDGGLRQGMPVTIEILFEDPGPTAAAARADG